jgi:hypothetical protein
VLNLCETARKTCREVISYPDVPREAQRIIKHHGVEASVVLARCWTSTGRGLTPIYPMHIAASSDER